MNQNWPEWLSLNENIRELKPYGAPQIPAQVRLNTNENPYPLDESLQSKIVTEISERVSDLNRYPDRDAVALRTALAEYINGISRTNFSYEHIWAANGSNEILQSIALAFAGDAMGFEPSYSMHPLITKSVGKKWISIARGPEFTFQVDVATEAIKTNRPGIVFVTTPNNPTGGSISLGDVAELAKVTLSVGAILVVDEAYAEFSKENSAVTLIKDYPNLIVSRTMSKAFAFAGARLGYMISNSTLVEAMLLVRLPYHLSELTQAAALAALKNRSALQQQVEQLKQSRDLLIQELIKLGLHVISSDANFVMFSGFKVSAQELWQKLVDRDVLIRDVGIPGYLRVTIGTEAENKAFLAALQQALNS
ncbi:MAG: histidinol-phosphate transaminase [Candidatus Nanopelagicaceae bacterium]|nr:histidinol-phosphate transaminase [Candidatus Nanopelagicaceae bacterium]